MSNWEASDLTALGQNLLACHASLYRYARALCHEPERADDLVQETFRRALSAKNQPDPATVEATRTWAFTIMRHIWQNELRQARRELPDEAFASEAAAGETVTPESVLSRKLLRSEIVHAIDSLPAIFREVIVLREIEGLTYEQIGRVLDCPRGTVMSRLSGPVISSGPCFARFVPSGWETEP